MRLGAEMPFGANWTSTNDAECSTQQPPILLLLVFQHAPCLHVLLLHLCALDLPLTLDLQQALEAIEHTLLEET